MTDDEDLRARLARLDPLRTAAAAALRDGPTGHEIRERVMQTIDEASTTSAPPVRRFPRRPLLVGAAAASVAGIALGAVLLGGGGDGKREKDAAPTTVALSVPPGTAMSSCMMFDTTILAGMPVAFAGTVTEVGSESVTLDVDRWYKGGTADRATISTPDGTTSAALDGVEFVQGGRFLVTATDGTVNGCGYSGPATAELEKAYAEAFGG